MQINNYQSIQAIPTMPQSTVSMSEANKAQVSVESGIQISISEQALRLSQSDNVVVPPINHSLERLSTEPGQALTGDKLAQAVQVKKAQAHYQVASDIMNVSSNDTNHMSVPTAYYLSKNENAREIVLETKSQQQTLENMQTYQEQTATFNEQLTI